MTDIRVTFGRHNGKLISQLPVDYISWGAKSITDSYWKSIFENELARRTGKATTTNSSNYIKPAIRLKSRKFSKRMRLVDHVFRNFFNKKDKENASVL